MITSIDLRNFRSYESSSFEFEPGVNIIVGPNASGKTNIIESILLATSGSSYRGRDVNLVMHNKEWSRIEMVSVRNTRVVKFQREMDKIKKTIEFDDEKKHRMPKSRIIQSVLFEPNHLLMFHGGPDARRDFIDTLLSNIYPEFASVRNQYKRTLLQRNTLLRGDNVKKDDLFIWNLRLSDLGGVIAKYRSELVNEMNKNLPDIYNNLATSKHRMDVFYVSKNRVDSYATDMLKRLESNLEVDIIRKHTTVGPHRDDIEIMIDGHDIKNVASRGEVRTVILSLKVFESIQLEKKLDIKPIILLDDVFSELDGSRRRSLTSYLGNSQVFITTTDADVVVQHFMENCKIIPLDK